MNVTLEMLLGLATLAIMALGFFWGVMRYIQSRIETNEKETTARIDAIRLATEARVEAIRASIDVKVGELHARVNDVRNEYVRRDELQQHLTRIESSLASITAGLNSGNNAVHRRIDEMMSLIAAPSRLKVEG